MYFKITGLHQLKNEENPTAWPTWRIGWNLLWRSRLGPILPRVVWELKHAGGLPEGTYLVSSSSGGINITSHSRDNFSANRLLDESHFIALIAYCKSSTDLKINLTLQTVFYILSTIITSLSWFMNDMCQTLIMLWICMLIFQRLLHL